MKRLLVNDAMNQLGETTFWTLLKDWFGMEFIGGDYATLAKKAEEAIQPNNQSLIVRNGSYFGPIMVDPVYASSFVPTISIIQDIFTEGSAREMQKAVMASSSMVVFNSGYCASKYLTVEYPVHHITIPLPVDFSVFEPGNPMGLQQALSLPDGCICWIGACREAGHIKGWDIFIQIARLNPDLHFVAVLKDAMPDSVPPNVRCYVRLSHDELVKVIGACRVGLCTSRMESQHLAGIEMGACGLPLVVPNVGTYWNRKDIDGVIIEPSAPEPVQVLMYGQAIRVLLSGQCNTDGIRAYWQREFDVPVIRAAWEKLVEEVECES